MMHGGTQREERQPLAEGCRGWSIDPVTTSDAFDALESDWRQLLEHTNTTIFQSFEWHRLWWKHFGEPNASAELHILTIRDGRRLIAIAPLFVETVQRLGIVRLRKLVFVGRETTDYLDLIIAKGEERACISLFSSYIAGHASLFDVIHLVDMPERTGNHALLHEELVRHGLAGEEFVNEYCPQAALGATWEETLGSIPSSKRSGLKRSQRKIESDFKVDLHIVDNAEALQNDFDEFVELHQRRWNESGQLGVFSSPPTAAFHQEFAKIAFERKWLFLAFLSLDGKRTAANYGFVYNKEFFYYLSGIQMQGELAKYSLGKVLHLYCIGEAIKRGVVKYDFMRGTERYKYDFNSVDAKNWTILMYPGRVAARRLKFKLVLLIDSMKRRATKEKFLLQHAAKENGGITSLLAERARTNFKDGIQKLKAPEKSLINRE